MTKSRPRRKLNVEEFLAWAEAQESGRYELEAGEVIAMAPERVQHVDVKWNVTSLLKEAIAKAGLPCHAYVDGLAVRIADDVTFEPDSLVVCGERLPPDHIVAAHPIIVVEVLSPSTTRRDLARKLAGYFTVASIEHYLIADPDDRRVIHHRRGNGDVLETRLTSAGLLSLDPPGLVIEVEAIFENLD